MVRAGIALGSNLGNRLANLQEARDRILALDQSERPVRQSSIYETSPVDCEPGAQNFYNAALEIGFGGHAIEVLHELTRIERELGRRREHAGNVSRLIDLDLLYFGDVQLQTPQLQLPHPRMKKREFVLRPLAEIAPDLRLPGETASVRELLAHMNSGEKVTRANEQW